MEEEKNRTEQYLSTLSTRDILNIVEEETIEKHINTIIDVIVIYNFIYLFIHYYYYIFF